MKKTLKTCPNGHQFYKSSDCPSCPHCDQQRRPAEGFMSRLGAPARRALETAGITTLKKLSTFTEKEILSLHGMGPKSIPTLKSALEAEGLEFKKKAPAQP
jgi:Bacterial RNA polymerase, alpha chain C terminal domain